MPDPVLLRKRSGGSGRTFQGKHYFWDEDGSAIEVPYELALDLLAIPDGDYSVDVPGQEITEPAPPWDHAVTEPAPKSTPVSEGSKAPESGDGSPITPKVRAGTRTTRPAAKK